MPSTLRLSCYMPRASQTKPSPERLPGRLALNRQQTRELGDAEVLQHPSGEGGALVESKEYSARNDESPTEDGG